MGKIENKIEATKEILQIDKSSKIIFTSANLTIKRTALALGAIDFKEKQKLIETIRKAL